MQKNIFAPPLAILLFVIYYLSLKKIPLSFHIFFEKNATLIVLPIFTWTITLNVP